MNEITFPYPVLGNGDDYSDSAFQAVVDIDLDGEEDDQKLKIAYRFNLSNQEIRRKIDEKNASYALEIVCVDSFFRSVLLVPEEGDHYLPIGDLYGRLNIQPLVIATGSVTAFSSTDFNEEYEGHRFQIEPGDMLAIDDMVVRYIEFLHLNFESLVRITTSQDVDPLEYGFDTENDLLTINMGEKFREIWNAYHIQQEFAPLLAMSVYKDCLVAALEAISTSDSDGDAEQWRWARALNTKLAQLNISVPENPDFTALNRVAQQLVQNLGVRRLSKNA